MLAAIVFISIEALAGRVKKLFSSFKVSGAGSGETSGFLQLLE
jgi:hypothetical protein